MFIKQYRCQNSQLSSRISNNNHLKSFMFLSSQGVSSSGEVIGPTGLGSCHPTLGGISRRPILVKSWVSRSASRFGVVSSFSPAKIELAPAKKQSACASSEREARPALRRTNDFGISILAVAIVLTNSKVSSSASDSGVPSTLTTLLIGTLSGWG